MIQSFGRIRRPKRVVVGLLFALFCWLLWLGRGPKTGVTHLDASTLQEKFPLAWKHVRLFNGTGGGTSGERLYHSASHLYLSPS